MKIIFFFAIDLTVIFIDFAFFKFTFVAFSFNFGWLHFGYLRSSFCLIRNYGWLIFFIFIFILIFFWVRYFQWVNCLLLFNFSYCFRSFSCSKIFIKDFIVYSECYYWFPSFLSTFTMIIISVCAFASFTFLFVKISTDTLILYCLSNFFLCPVSSCEIIALETFISTKEEVDCYDSSTF